MKQQLFIFIILGIFFATGCKENHTPKPHGYLRIDVPKDHKYNNVTAGLPFKMAYSNYAKFDTLKVSKKSRPNTQWYNVSYPRYNAKIHLSYIPIENNLDSLLEESHKFAFEHTIRADAIDETTFNKTDKKIHGILFDLKGNSASNMEFLATDSTQHFLRGALYFDTTPNVDSLAPIINYIKEDMIYMINSLEWTCQ